MSNNTLAIDAGSVVGRSFKPTQDRPVPSVRCTYTWPEGHSREGERCRKWSLRGAMVCMKHGAQLENVRQHAAAQVELARMRIVGLSDDAIDGIEDLMQNATSEAVRLKVYTEILDRAGIRGGTELDVQLSAAQDPAETLRERLRTLQSRTTGAIEAEPGSIEDVPNASDGVTVTQSDDTDTEEQT